MLFDVLVLGEQKMRVMTGAFILMRRLKGNKANAELINVLMLKEMDAHGWG